MSTMSSKSYNVSYNQNVQSQSAKSAQCDHTPFNGLGEYAEPPNNLPSQSNSNSPNNPRKNHHNSTHGLESGFQNNDYFDTWNYLTEDVFTNVFSRLGSQFFRDDLTSYYSALSNTSVFDKTHHYLKSNGRMDRISEPVTIDKCDLFRPSKSHLNVFGSSTIFPKFKSFQPEVEDFLLSHSQNFIDERDSYVIKTKFPGYNKNDISVNVNGKYLEISAVNRHAGENIQNNSRMKSRSTSSYNTTLTIPPGVIANAITARYRDGVLTVKLPKNNINSSYQARLE